MRSFCHNLIREKQTNKQINVSLLHKHFAFEIDRSYFSLNKENIINIIIDGAFKSLLKPLGTLSTENRNRNGDASRQSLRENPNNQLRMTGGKNLDVLRSAPT